MSYWENARPIQRSRAVDTAAVARASAELLDTGGLRALTVRAVAAQLGVAPASLYSRISAVSDLYDLALDATLGGDAQYAAALDDAGIEELLLGYYRHLVRHPWAYQVIAARAPRGPNYLRLSERMVVLLERAGHAEPLETAYTLSNFVIGSASTTRMAPGELGTSVPVDIAPRYAAYHAQGRLEPERLLRAGLRALLAGSPRRTPGSAP